MQKQILIFVAMLLYSCGGSSTTKVKSKQGNDSTQQVEVQYKPKYAEIQKQIIEFKKEDFMRTSDVDSSYYSAKFHKVFSLKNLDSDLSRRFDEQLDSFIIELSMRCSIDIKNGKVVSH